MRDARLHEMPVMKWLSRDSPLECFIDLYRGKSLSRAGVQSARPRAPPRCGGRRRRTPPSSSSRPGPLRAWLSAHTSAYTSHLVGEPPGRHPRPSSVDARGSLVRALVLLSIERVHVVVGAGDDGVAEKLHTGRSEGEAAMERRPEQSYSAPTLFSDPAECRLGRV